MFQISVEFGSSCSRFPSISTFFVQFPWILQISIFLLFPLISAHVLPSVTNFHWPSSWYVLQSNFLRIKFPFLRFHFFPLNTLSQHLSSLLLSPLCFFFSFFSRFFTTNFHIYYISFSVFIFFFSLLRWLISLFSNFSRIKISFLLISLCLTIILPIFLFVIRLSLKIFLLRHNLLPSFVLNSLILLFLNFRSSQTFTSKNPPLSRVSARLFPPLQLARTLTSFLVISSSSAASPLLATALLPRS